MYNVKVKKFARGEVQTRVYSHMIWTDTKHERHEPEPPETVVEPFEGDEVIVVRDFMEEEKKHERSVQVSLNRAKATIYDLARANDWDYFVTLTLSSDKVNRYDYNECSKKVRKWLNHMRERAGNDFKYLVVPERHLDGAYHFHGLFGNVDGLEMTDSGHKDSKGRIIYNIGKYKLGWTTATAVSNNQAVTKYITKYTTKDLIESTKGKSKYWASKNCNRPVEETMLYRWPEKDALEYELQQDCTYYKKQVYEVGAEKRMVKYYENINPSIPVFGQE